MAATGGLSQEEFIIIQEQLIDLRKKNYELQSELKKKSAELTAIQSQQPKNEALQFASKLINRNKDKDKAATEKLEGDLEGMRRKLIMQEEEFRLQQETLITELNKVITQCGQQQKELEKLREDVKKKENSNLSHPLAMEMVFDNSQKNTDVENDKLEGLLVDSDYSTPIAEHSDSNFRGHWNVETTAQQKEEILTLMELAKEKEQSSIVHFQETITTLNSEIANLKENIVNTEQALVERKECCSILESKLSNMFGENQSLTEKVSNLENNLQKSVDSVFEKDVLLNALENQIIEYKNKAKEAQLLQQKSEQEQHNLLTQLEEKELRLQTFTADFGSIRSEIDQKSSELSQLTEELSQTRSENNVLLSQIEEEKRLMASAEKKVDNLKKENEAIRSEREDEARKKSEMEEEISANRRQIEFLKNQLKEFEEKIDKQKETNDKFKRELKEQISYLKQQHIADTETALAEKNQEIEKEMKAGEVSLKSRQLSSEILILSERHEFDMLVKEEMYSERIKMEVAEVERAFALQKMELEQKIESLDEALKGKDHENVIALKKQSALVKELKRSLAEEKKRSEGIERATTTHCMQQAGWTVVSDPVIRSTNTFDGNDSVSSLSVLESDNVELITRLTKMQKDHSETIDKLNQMESENIRLRQEIHEKSEVIEHWIRTRPTDKEERQSGSVGSNFRKFIAATIADESAVDIRETNKKLQRMLEETLSKNISLQRDLQTLLERTEM